MKNIGYAIDIGTTIINTCLVDIDSKKILSERSVLNRQSLYGRDVINRILTVTRDFKYLKILKDLVTDSIHDILIEMLEEVKATPSEINIISVSGNTTMISILLEYDIKELGVYPFSHRLRESCLCNTSQIFGETFPTSCDVFLSGCASAFIGGDILSGLVYLNNHKKVFSDFSSTCLFIDLGTNGELVLKKGNTYIATSASCGPAFEASLTKQNVYTSTIIDTIALGIKTRNISITGVLKDEYLANGITVMGVNLTQDIIHEVILAKAAIYTAIEYLIKKANITIDMLDKVYIAGGVGLHLDINNAIFIGLLPKGILNKTEIVGNSSLLGGIDIVCNRDNINKINYFTDDIIKVLQLANEEDYEDKLLNNMTFEVK